MEITKHKKTKLSVCALAFGFFTAASALAASISEGDNLGKFQGAPENYASGDVFVEITGGKVSDQFAGGSLTGQQIDGNVKIEMTGGDMATWLIGGNVYSSKDGSFGGVSGNIDISVTGGKVFSIRGGHSLMNVGHADGAPHRDTMTVGGNVSIYVGGNTVVTGDNAASPSDNEAILGAGGSQSSVKGDVSITIDGNASVSGAIYGGAARTVKDPTKYAADSVDDLTDGVRNTFVTVKGGTINGDIYGGAQKHSSVGGDTNVTIEGGSINGNVYAGGGSSMTLVRGNATVTISGGTFSGGAVIDGCAGTVEGTSVLNIVNTDATAGTTIQNFDKVVVSGTSNFTIGAVADGVTVTAFGGTLAGTQFTAGTVANVSADESGAIAQENQSVAANTSVTISQKSDTVTLSTASAAITVAKAESLDTGTVSVSEIGAVVLSAWSFEITNSGADVMVTLDVGQDVALDSIRVYHEENGNWTDVTDQVGNIVSKNGKVSFTTNKFSGYAVAAVPSIPEPSQFGLLAGLAALALAGTRRRRRK